MSTINGCDLLGFVALRDPSRLITTSELSIISMLCPDKMLPSRSGTGAASTTTPDWGTSIPLLQGQICSVTIIEKRKISNACCYFSEVTESSSFIYTFIYENWGGGERVKNWEKLILHIREKDNCL